VPWPAAMASASGHAEGGHLQLEIACGPAVHVPLVRVSKSDC
jgi:hypothetical protein